MGETVLLEVFCRCGASHDVWATESAGRYDVKKDDLRCPSCSRTMVIGMEPRESLA